MTTKIFQVDSFAREPFKGNPAAVCLIGKWPDERWMQNLAMEMNLSETAFALPQDDGFGLRWFTPAVEVDLCGHATLATAHILWEEGVQPADRDLIFYTKSGKLVASRSGDDIQLDFPSYSFESVALDPRLAEAMGEEPLDVMISDNMYIVELASEDVVRNLSPNLELIRFLPVDSVVVTAQSSSLSYDFVSRCFCPKVGIDEDPVTGAIHCSLGPYWREKLGKDEFIAFQASSRGGMLGVRIAGDRVFLTGQAVTIFRGTLVI